MRTQTAHPRPHLRSGLTLVEVVAALTLLAGSVTAMLLAQSRSLRQLTEAQFRGEAAVLAEELMRNWQLVGENVLDPAEGPFPGNPEWRWRRTSSELQDSAVTTLQQVNLEIIRVGEGQAQQQVLSYSWLERGATPK